MGRLIAAVQQVLREHPGDDAGNGAGTGSPELLAQVRLLVEGGVLTPSV